MNYTVPQQVNDARHITRAAEQQIMHKTGMRVTLVLCPDYHTSKTPEQMLRVIADAIGMDVACYKVKSRERDFVDLRFIAASLLRSFFPGITLHDITILFGGQDHTSVINGISRAAMLLAAGDEKFTCKYETALKSVNKWIRKEVLEFASAISA